MYIVYKKYPISWRPATGIPHRPRSQCSQPRWRLKNWCSALRSLTHRCSSPENMETHWFWLPIFEHPKTLKTYSWRSWNIARTYKNQSIQGYCYCISFWRVHTNGMHSREPESVGRPPLSFSLKTAFLLMLAMLTMDILNAYHTAVDKIWNHQTSSMCKKPGCSFITFVEQRIKGLP